MRLFVYDMLVNVNVIYYVHVCEQARWARSAGNSAIEKLTEVTKQNKDMKSQIDDLRKYISVIKTGLAKQQTPAITAPQPNHTDRDARTTRDSPPIRSISTRSSPRHTDRDARTPRERMAECIVSPGKTHVLIGDSVFRQISQTRADVPSQSTAKD